MSDLSDFDDSDSPTHEETLEQQRIADDSYFQGIYTEGNAGRINDLVASVPALAFQGRAKQLAVQIGVPEVELKRYAKSRWLLDRADRMGIDPEAIRDVLIVYFGKGETKAYSRGSRGKNIAPKTLADFSSAELRHTFANTKRHCLDVYVAGFERKYGARII